MPITSNREEITCAALGDNDKGLYAIHLVNNGPERETTLTGLPERVEKLQMYITDAERDMKKGPVVKVSKGKATFQLDAASYVTLMNQ